MNTIEYLLACCAEEGAEIAQDCMKSQRFGLEDVNILTPGGPPNRDRLVDELNDMMGVIVLLVDYGIIPRGWYSPEKIQAKRLKVLKLMKYAAEVGALNDYERQRTSTDGRPGAVPGDDQQTV